MATHDGTTPRPWRVAIGGGADNALYLASQVAGYVPLATPYREDAFTVEEEASCIEARERCAAARANAALIVRAVNAHDAMREALRRFAFVPCERTGNIHCTMLPAGSGVRLCMACEARAALALAEGGD